jgi:hypothetical protein
MKALDQISFQFDVDKDKVEAYFERVQKYFAPPSPTHKAIANFILERRFATLPEPNMLATELHKDKGLALKPRYTSLLSPIGHYVPDKKPRIPFSETKDVVKRHYLTERRIKLPKVRHCPHGIPYYEKCSTCNRKKRIK